MSTLYSYSLQLRNYSFGRHVFSDGRIDVFTNRFNRSVVGFHRGHVDNSDVEIDTYHVIARKASEHKEP